MGTPDDLYFPLITLPHHRNSYREWNCRALNHMELKISEMHGPDNHNGITCILEPYPRTSNFAHSFASSLPSFKPLI